MALLVSYLGREGLLGEAWSEDKKGGELTSILHRHYVKLKILRIESPFSSFFLLSFSMTTALKSNHWEFF